MAKTGILKNIQSRTGTQDSQSASLTIKDIPIGDIEIRENIRKEYTGIEGLADSIRQHGLLQAITIYPNGDIFIVKTGHRRFMAYKRIYETEPDRFHSIRCIISTADNLAIVQMVENLQREDLSPSDLCNALTALRKQGISNQEIAEAMGKSAGYVNNLFCAVKEVHENQNIAEKTHVGVSLQDITETKGILDEQTSTPKRLNLLITSPPSADK
jgi:ParB family chromosome partitioning protein